MTVLAKIILSEEDKAFTEIMRLSWTGEYQYHMPPTVQIWSQNTTIFDSKCGSKSTRQNFIMPKNWISICLTCGMA